jgi:hypothetical protein
VSNNLVGEMPAGAVDLGGSAQAASVGYPVGAIHFGPAWEDDSVQLTHKGWSQITDGMAKSIVRLECEADELRAEVAMIKQGMVILAEERDEARKLARWFYTRLKQVCLDRGILARLDEAVIDDPWLEAAK